MKRIFFIVVTVVSTCLCFSACSEHNSNNTNSVIEEPESNISISSSQSAENSSVNSTTSTSEIPLDGSSKGNGSTPEEYAENKSVIYWTDDPQEVTLLEELQHKKSLSDDEILLMVPKLLDKAWYLCYLAYKEVDPPFENQKYSVVDYEGDPRADGSTCYYPTKIIPYQSTEDLWKDVNNTFESQTAQTQFQFISTLYKDINNQLYCNTDTDGQGRGRSWNPEYLEIQSISDDVITLQMQVEFMESSWKDNLEIVFSNGVWVLNESYFTFQAQ